MAKKKPTTGINNFVAICLFNYDSNFLKNVNWVLTFIEYNTILLLGDNSFVMHFSTIRININSPSLSLSQFSETTGLQAIHRNLSEFFLRNRWSFFSKFWTSCSDFKCTGMNLNIRFESFALLHWKISWSPCFGFNF